jgi:pyruvyl transferase EpsO
MERVTEEPAHDWTLRLEELKGTILAMLRPLIGEHRTCVVVDFPNHDNVGDNAIWLGEMAALDALGVEVRYVCDTATYRRQALEEALGRTGLILLHGGGNFGDLYPRHHQLRQRVLDDFPHHQTIQLPQTIWFTGEGSATLEHTRRTLGRRKAYTLLVRDQPSLQFAKENFNADVRLCPDMAFALGPQPRHAKLLYDVVVLGRTDKEAVYDWRSVMDPAHRVLVTDWPAMAQARLALHPGKDSSSERLEDWFYVWMERLYRRSPVAPPAATHRLFLRRWNALAGRRVRQGMNLLASGKTVITDRLHAHVFCTLMGIPHVVLDNNYGKVRAVSEAWTASLGFARWARNPGEAIALARKLSDLTGTQDEQSIAPATR